MQDRCELVFENSAWLEILHIQNIYKKQQVYHLKEFLYIIYTSNCLNCLQNSNGSLFN